jgi:drug/metabolite transporter (DMT)-like permease
MAIADTSTPSFASGETRRLLRGIGVGLLAASIGALYVVFARWGLQHGASPMDLTALRFGVSGLILLPILVLQWRRAPAVLTGQWRIWPLFCLLAGTPFGLLMFGALQLAPASHAAIFPFAAMSVMGMVIAAITLGDRLTLRRVSGIGIVVGGLVLISGIRADSFTASGLLGDAMFVLAGTLWAGFGVLLRKHRLDPVLATAVIAFSALVTFVPVYLSFSGGGGLFALDMRVLLVEILVQGVIAGVGTLFTYASMVGILGPARAAIFPALAPGLATLLAWPVLAHMPGPAELAGLFAVIVGLIWAVTGQSSPVRR